MVEEKAKKPIAYSYVRMSSKQQIKGDSLRRQLELSRKYAAEHDLVLDETLSDIGVSAWTGDNLKDGALGRFLKLVSEGRVKRGSYLLVESLDRLSRQQVRNAIGPFVDIINAGISIVTLADRQVYSEATVDENWTQLMMSLAIMSRAHEESQIKSQRLKEAHARRKQKALAGQGTFSPNIWAWLDTVQDENGNTRFVLNDHAETVRKIFEYADSGLGQLVITRRLNEAGVPAFKGSERGWQQPIIGKILSNEAVIGTYQPTQAIDGKTRPFGESIPNYLPKIVSDDLFWRIQRNKRYRKPAGQKGKRLTNILGPIACCGVCGGGMRMKTGGYHLNPKSYIRCDSNYRGGPCKSKGGQFPYDVVEKAILDHVKEFQLDRIFSHSDRSADEIQLNEIITTGEASVTELSSRRSKIMRAIEFAQSDEETEELMQKQRKLREQIDDAKSRIHAVRQELALLNSDERTATEFAERLQIERLLWTTGNDDEVYESRSRISQALNRFIDMVSFDSNDRTFAVTIGSGLIAYKFNKKGELLKRVNLSPELNKRTLPVFWNERDENGRAIEGRGTVIVGKGITLDNFAKLPEVPSNSIAMHERMERLQRIADLNKQE